MDEFTSRIDELSSQLSRGFNYGSQSQQKLESSNGSTSTSYFTSNGTTVRHSSSLTQLAKDSPINEEVIIYVLLKIDVWILIYNELCIKQISGIARSQLKIMHQLDVLNTSLRDKMGKKSRQEREVKKSQRSNFDGVVVPLLLALACGGVGIFLFKGVSQRNWYLLLLIHLFLLVIFGKLVLDLFDKSECSLVLLILRSKGRGSYWVLSKKDDHFGLYAIFFY